MSEQTLKRIFGALAVLLVLWGISALISSRGGRGRRRLHRRDPGHVVEHRLVLGPDEHLYDLVRDDPDDGAFVAGQSQDEG